MKTKAELLDELADAAELLRAAQLPLTCNASTRALGYAVAEWLERVAPKGKRS